MADTVFTGPPELTLCRMIAASEVAIRCATLWQRYHVAPARKQEWENRAAECCERHAQLVAAYEQRFGDVPRVRGGGVDTRGPDHWNFHDEHFRTGIFDPLPEVRRG